MDKAVVEAVNAYYEEWMFGVGAKENQPPLDKIGFSNLGYWKGVEDSAEIAQINLIETLVRFFTNKDGTSSVLDVACGRGASTKFLTKYFNPNYLTGINISTKQLEICRMVAPECDFKLMDATELDFDDSSFDNVLCIEAAFHFSTRDRFLEEAYRVLKPGGRLAMSDILFDNDALEAHTRNESISDQLKMATETAFPRANYLPNLEAYRERLRQVGFQYNRVDDITDDCWNAMFERYGVRMAEMEFERTRDYTVLHRWRQPRVCIASCFVFAIK